MQLDPENFNMADAPDGRVSKQLLKTRSGEFDIESIHSLCLRDAGVSDLGCIGECRCLERLDLSRNDITKLQRLAGLNQLLVLNLSANRITSLEGLQSLENLHTLNLAGNLIGGLDSLMCLTGMDKLEELRLQDKVSGLSNPVCQHVHYVEEIQKMFTKLVTLDGDRLRGKGSELYQLCRQIDTALHKDPGKRDQECNVPSVTPWVTSEYWQVANTFRQSNLYDAETQLRDLLASCKRSTEQSEEKLLSMMTSSSQLG